MAAGVQVPAPDGSGVIRVDGSRRLCRVLGIFDVPPGSQQVSGTITNPEFQSGEFWHYFIIPGFTFWPVLTLSGDTLTWDWQFYTTGTLSVKLVYGVR